MRILLTISYLGTAYHGFQVQLNGMTVQQRLQDAVESVFGYRCPLTGCSRTDSGVHANMFCCTIDTADAPNRIPADRICDALNHSLPDDIAVKSAYEVADSFHPRYDVAVKEYIYIIWNARARNPFMSDRAFHYPAMLDASLMDSAARHFIGRHDFAAFCASGSSVSDTVREIYTCGTSREGDIITITVRGNGFLYNMVRIIAGTLIYVSEGRLSPDDIPSVIESRERKNAGFTAPPQGLYLNYVGYGEKPVS